MYGQHTANQTL